MVRPLRHPVWERPHTRILGLDGRAEPLSGGDGRGGAAPRKEEKWIQFDAGGAQQEEEQDGEFKI
jgi:hypothetical protein